MGVFFRGDKTILYSNCAYGQTSPKLEAELPPPIT